MVDHDRPHDIPRGDLGVGPAIARPLEVRCSGPGSGLRGSESVLHADPSTGLLFAPQHEQLGVGGKDLAQSELKGAAGGDAPADVVHPVFGDAFDPFRAGGNENP
jgi:hypothetical protein